MLGYGNRSALGRFSLLVSTGFLAMALKSPPAYAWGAKAHRLVNNLAVQCLPSEVRVFFEANRQFLADHANDPEEWVKKDKYEAKRHCIYLDKYGIFPYLRLPHNYKAAIQAIGAGRIANNGTLPWQIGQFSLRLTNAFKARNWEQAKLDAAALGFYVAEAHDPLSTTQNYDGQLTQQTGLGRRFGTSLLERYATFFMLHPEDASKIDDPTEYAFQAVLEANTWVNHIILMDLRAKEGLDDYNDEYFDWFYTQVGATATREINQAAHDTGSYWYSAWLNAGSPPVPAH